MTTDNGEPAARAGAPPNHTVLSTLWHWHSSPARAIEGAYARRAARLLATLLFGLVVLGVGGAVTVMVTGPNPIRSWPMWAAAVVLAVAYGLSRARRCRSSVMLGLVVLSTLPFAMIVAGGDYSEQAFLAFVWSVLTLLIASLFLSVTGTVVVAAFHILGLFVLILLVPSLTFSTILLPAGLLLSASGLMVIAARHRDYLEQDRQAKLVEVNRELCRVRNLLEQEVKDRAEELTRRARHLEATAAIARDAASVLDLGELLTRAVTLISERFGFYHCGVFLLDARRDWAVLKAASSPGGQRMLARNYRLRVGQEGIIGYVTGQGEARVALDVGADAVFFDNPDLPQARSEVALPLRSRGEIIGALDVQSREPEAFKEDDVAVLQTLADQVAVAISNARLFQQVQEGLEAEHRAYGDMTREAWQELLREQKGMGFVSDGRGTFAIAKAWEPHIEMAVQTGEPSMDRGDGAGPAALAVPVRLRDQVIGVIDAHLPQGGRRWSPEQVALLQTLADRLGEALEGAQLYRSAQQRVARERLTREITDKLRSALKTEVLLQTAIRETAQALGASRAFVQWTGEPQPAEGVPERE